MHKLNPKKNYTRYLKRRWIQELKNVSKAFQYYSKMKRNYKWERIWESGNSSSITVSRFLGRFESERAPLFIDLREPLLSYINGQDQILKPMQSQPSDQAIVERWVTSPYGAQLLSWAHFLTCAMSYGMCYNVICLPMRVTYLRNSLFMVGASILDLYLTLFCP